MYEHTLSVIKFSKPQRAGCQPQMTICETLPTIIYSLCKSVSCQQHAGGACSIHGLLHLINTNILHNYEVIGGIRLLALNTTVDFEAAMKYNHTIPQWSGGHTRKPRKNKFCPRGRKKQLPRPSGSFTRKKKSWKEKDEVGERFVKWLKQNGDRRQGVAK